MAEFEPFLTRDEACEHLGVGKERLRKLVKEGMPYYQPNKVHRTFKASEIDAWMRKHKQVQKPAPHAALAPARQLKPQIRRATRKNGDKITMFPKQR